MKNYLATAEGLLAVSLIKEFLDFFNLEFTSLVFDPETHAGIDYTYEGRQKISKDLKIDIIGIKFNYLNVFFFLNQLFIELLFIKDKDNCHVLLKII